MACRDGLLSWAHAHSLQDCDTCTRFLNESFTTPTVPNMLRHMVARHNYKVDDEDPFLPWWKRMWIRITGG